MIRKIDKRTVDLSNQKFGKLTALILVKNYKNRHGTFWNCKCDCGNDTVVRADGLKTGRIVSCGCIKYGTRKNNHSFKGYEEISLTFYNRIKYGAKSRNDIPFDLPIEHLWQLFLKQNRKCSLTGLELTFSKFSGQSDGTASLDRIDSSKGYVEGNVQWVHKDINFMKHQLSENRFKELCKLVTTYHA